MEKCAEDSCATLEPLNIWNLHVSQYVNVNWCDLLQDHENWGWKGFLNELPGLGPGLTPFCYLIYVYFIIYYWLSHYQEISPKWEVFFYFWIGTMLKWHNGLSLWWIWMSYLFICICVFFYRYALLRFMSMKTSGRSVWVTVGVFPLCD